jgi:hypothetical protein
MNTYFIKSPNYLKVHYVNGVLSNLALGDCDMLSWEGSRYHIPFWESEIKPTSILKKLDDVVE